MSTDFPLPLFAEGILSIIPPKGAAVAVFGVDVVAAVVTVAVDVTVVAVVASVAVAVAAAGDVVVIAVAAAIVAPRFNSSSVAGTESTQKTKR